MRKLILAAALVALSSPVAAQTTTTITTPDQLTWRDQPALPKGAQIADLLGDGSKAGDVVVYRLKVPANYRIPPHTHPGPETVTVISGGFGIGMGETFNEQSGQMMKAGAFWAFPPKHAHYAWTGNEEAIIQVQTIGPTRIDYVNPADDPRRSQ